MELPGERMTTVGGLVLSPACAAPVTSRLAASAAIIAMFFMSSSDCQSGRDPTGACRCCNYISRRLLFRILRKHYRKNPRRSALDGQDSDDAHKPTAGWFNWKTAELQYGSCSWATHIWRMSWMSLNDCHSVDLDQEFRSKQSRYLNRRAGRRAHEIDVPVTHLAQFGQVRNIHQVDVELDDIVEAPAGRLEGGLQVFEHLLNLCPIVVLPHHAA